MLREVSGLQAGAMGRRQSESADSAIMNLVYDSISDFPLSVMNVIMQTLGIKGTNESFGTSTGLALVFSSLTHIRITLNI